MKKLKTSLIVATIITLAGLASCSTKSTDQSSEQQTEEATASAEQPDSTLTK
jgi:hypothetical protein